LKGCPKGGVVYIKIKIPCPKGGVVYIKIKIPCPKGGVVYIKIIISINHRFSKILKINIHQKIKKMKKSVLILMCLFLVGATFTLKSQNMTQQEKNSYALGFGAGDNYKNLGLEKNDLNFNSFLQGFTDAFVGENKFTMEEMQACFQDLQNKIEKRQNAGLEVVKEQGKQFLAENKNQEGVIETESGLQYKVIVMGNGPKPLATDKVKVHYHGTVIDGTVFDSSVQRGEPIDFVLNQVIRGWTEGLQLMPVGSKFIFYIPSELAYGDENRGPVIKGGSTLIFEVELFDILK
jgi:FKBP-type peptidyl-prolyl cis-trans isomerase